MGLAASQARLLSLTSRIHDVEFEAQQLQYAKMRLALLEDEASKRYLEALDAETLTIPGPNGSRIKANFDNMCGLGSIYSNFGNKQPIFRDKHDNIMVPHEIFVGYQNCGSDDPYDFAMYMMGVSGEDYENYKSQLIDSVNKTADVKKQELFDEITKYYATAKGHVNPENPDYQGSLEKFQHSVLYSLMSGNTADLKDLLSDENNNLPAGLDDKEIENLMKKANEYEFILFNKTGGAKSIYEECGPAGTFDEKEFDYYLHWGQIIRDNTLNGCVDASSGDDGIENNAELLNQNIMYGYVSIDNVYFDNKGGISYVPTSTSTDSTISMEKTESVDSTAVKKAEVEYNTKLKEINRIDKNYDLNLNRLETERTALTTEYDSVKKVIEDNINRTFKIFS